MAPHGSPDTPPPGGLVLVHVASSSMEAHALRGRLEAEDIPVFVKGEHEGPYRMAYGPVLMFVPEDLEVQARLVLAQALSGGLRVSDDDDLIAETDWSQAESSEERGQP